MYIDRLSIKNLGRRALLREGEKVEPTRHAGTFDSGTSNEIAQQ